MSPSNATRQIISLAVLPRILVFLLCVSLASCDAIQQIGKDESPQEIEDTEILKPVPIEASAEPPMASPTEPDRPLTPEEAIAAFLALKSFERDDEELAKLARVEQGLGEIETLDLSNSPVSDEGLQHLVALPQLRQLDLTKTRINGSGLKALSGLDSIETLSLDSTSLNNEAVKLLAEMKSLRSLNLANTAIGDEIFTALAELPHLEQLVLDGNKIIMGKQFAELVKQKRFRELKELSAQGTQFGFYGMLTAHQLDQLTTLNLASSNLNDAAMKAIAGCEALLHLNVSRNKLSNQGISCLKKTKSLEHLDVEDCRGVSDPCLDALKTLKGLKTLNLSETACTVPAVRQLKERFLKDTEITHNGETI